MKKKILSVLTLAFFLINNSIAQNGRITPEMIADLRFVSEVSLSPGSKEVCFIQRAPADTSDKSGMMKSILQKIAVRGGSVKTIAGTDVNPSSIRWSPDGKRIFFIAKDSVTKNNQVFSIDLPENSPQKITSCPSSVVQYEFSPDGKRLALTYPDPQTDEEKANEKKKRDWVIYGENLKFTRLYITDGTPGAEVRKIFEQNLHITEFTWSADSKTIVFKATESPETDHTYMFQKIYRVDVADGKPEVVCRTEGKIGHITVSPDGKTLAYCGAVDITDPQSQSLFIVPVTGGTPRNLTEKFEGSVSDMKWLNNTTLMVNSILGCYTLFSKMDIATGSKTSIDTKGLIFRSWDIAPQNGILVLAANSPQHPSELFSGSISKPEFTRLTFSNQELNNIALAKQEVIEWKHPDGLRIEGVLTYPLNYETGKKYPLIFQLHGGPESASLNGWTTRSLYPVQLYAAAGYFVLEPNYRGSIGRGVEFSKGDHKDLAGKEFEDILAGIDFLAGKGMVDASRVGCGGFSYGGYLSAWAATKHSQRFKAAMMGAGISDWISFVNTTDIIYENSLVHWNLWWYDNMQLVWDRSPMAHINNAKTPTLIIHGEKDLRVPISQGEELYYGLKTKGIDVQLVKYKRQGHGISEREGQLDFMKRTLEWFEKYLKE